MPMKKTLRIMLIVFSIIPAFIVGSLTYSYVEKTLVASKEQDLDYLSSYSASQVSLIFSRQMYELNNQSRMWIYRFSLEDPDNMLYPESVQKSLLSVAEKYPYCTSLDLYDANGRFLMSSDPSASEDKDRLVALPASATREKSHPMFSVSKTGSFYILHITKAVLSESDEISGYLCSCIKVSHFQYLFDYLPGDSGDISLVDKNGMILYAKNHSLINTTLKNQDLISILSKPKQIIAKTLKIHEGGSEYLAAVSPIEDSDCFILIKQNTREIIHGSDLILYALLICSLAVFVLVYFASNVFAHYYTAPIFMLRDTMKEVSNGEFSVRCQIDSKNEAGDLARSFNKMIHIIQSSYEDLASMHEQLMDNAEEIRSNYNHIEYLAYHDLITDLPNKLFFLEKMDRLLSSEKDGSQMHAIYFIDLDNFKTINDTLGHDFGDELLNRTGQKLLSLVNSQDMVARVGGDEFLIFKYNIASTREAFAFAQELLNSFGKPFVFWEETMHISLSIGISIYPLHGTAHTTLIKNADIAMYHSKENGKNRVSLFDKSMSDEINRSAEILEVLRTVIEKEELYLLYQPQFDIASGEIVGYEALMRINSKKLGPLSPKDFIPIAEEGGLIVKLGEWALREACRFNRSLLDNSKRPRPVSVNISSIQLNQPEFVNTVQKILSETGLPANYLSLEITESTLISSFVDTVSVLRRFQEMGVGISLDDFGTGYSSLKYLTSLPITTLKIDKSFVDNICSLEKDRMIAACIISLAHKIEVNVVAEGVEKEEQYELLKTEECDIIQGYLLSRPIPPDILNDLLNSSS